MDVTIIDQLMSYIPSEMIIVAIALSCIGTFLKVTPKFPSWLIPYALILLGIAGCSLLSQELTIQSACYGVLSGTIAVTGHQIFKQTKNKNN